MHKLCLLALAAACASPVAAQQRFSLLFNGRFPFVSLDAPRARPGSSIVELSQFGASIVTPGPGAVARNWVPATSLEAWMGDVTRTGDYTPLRGFKTYGERIDLAGVFVKWSDRTSGDPRKIYYTVRDQVSGKDFVFFDNFGSTVVTIQPGDFFRILENGNLELFCTVGQFATAAGQQSGAHVHGAHAICQDAAGNLYYTPAEGGHWVNGNAVGPKFAFDGSILKIPASAITYDASGNVASIAPNSAYMLFSETETGTNGGPSVRDMVHSNAGAFNALGNPIGGAGGVTTNMVGLALDPNGGTITAAYEPIGGTHEQVPNMIFAWDSGTWGGTIFSTAPNFGGLPGSIAVINGVKCGSDVAGVPADGSWLGVRLDTANFQPTLMGLAVVPAIGFTPAVCDVPDLGGLDPSVSTLHVDYHGPANAGVFMLLQFLTLAPPTPGLFVPSLDIGPLGLLGRQSYQSLFTLPNAISQPIVAFAGGADANGYLTFSVANPNTPAGLGTTLILQGVLISGSNLTQLTNPAILQFK